MLDNAAVQALADDVGEIDILFNCAGVVHGGTMLEATLRGAGGFAFDLNVMLDGPDDQGGPARDAGEG